MQDLGILVMLAEMGSRYQKLLGRILQVGHLHLPALEIQEFGITHAHVSAALLQKWGLPTSMTKIIARHHDAVDDEQLAPVERELLAAARIGDAFADFRDSPCLQRHERLSRALTLLGGAESDFCRDCIAIGIKKTLESAQIFAVAVPAELEWNQMLKRMVDAPDDGDECAEAPPLESDGEESPLSEAPRIVVVDDDPLITELIRDSLTPLGFEVDVPADFDEALEAAGSAAAFLCDVHLPGRNGIELVRLLRERGFTGSVLMISGDRSRQTVLDSINAGIVDFIPKPFTRRSLLEKLERSGIRPPAPSLSATV
jgi:CheY-like chemotaxis protein